MRAEALSLFGLQTRWQSRRSSSGSTTLLVEVPTKASSAQSAVLASAIDWLVSLDSVCQVSVQHVDRPSLLVRPDFSPAHGFELPLGDVVSASGKRLLCEKLMALRAQIRMLDR